LTTRGGALEARAEIVKLARLLQRDPDSLSYLSDVPASELAALRERVTDRLFDAQGGALQRLARASRVLPVGLLATLGERTFGALLCARFAALLEPERAVEIAAKLPTSFLADVAVELDPRRTHDVIAGIPVADIAAVAHELARRSEYVALGRFVGHISDEALRDAVAEIDDTALLQIAFVLENKDGLDALAGVLGVERVAGMVRAAENSGLEAEGLDLLVALSPHRREAIIAELSDDERARLADRAREAGVSIAAPGNQR
jgi:hypothetical protein